MAADFIAVFGVSTLAHIYQTVKCQQKWIVVMVIGGIPECLGWGFRLLSRYGRVYDGYIGQLCCLVIAPTFFSAAMYMLLGLLIALVAPQASWLSPRQFKITFIVADFVSLVLQAAGGGTAATAETPKVNRLGSNLMLGGIIFQLAVMVIFFLYGVVWGWKSKKALRNAGPKLLQLSFGMAVCSAAIILRGSYRSAELAQGFSGPLARDQITFLLDAIPSSVAIIAINIFHPHRLLDVSLATLDPRERYELEKKVTDVEGPRV